MRAFNYTAIRDQKWDSDVLGLVAGIYREVGKQEVYLKQHPKELELLTGAAKLHSAEDSNAIEGITTTDARLRRLVERRTQPTNRNEQEIAGYCDCLDAIFEDPFAAEITPNYILKLHEALLRYTENPKAGQLKDAQNFLTAIYSDGHGKVIFTPLPPCETEAALAKICEEFNRVIGNHELEPLIAIPVFIHDFLCIHPFLGGNGRISRLLTTLLLFRSGLQVGKYISLESKIAKHRDLYYDALAKSQIGWHTGDEDVLPFLKFLLGTIIAAYKDFSQRAEIIAEELPAIEIVRKAVAMQIGRFTKRDIWELCSVLSLNSVEGALRKLVAAGELNREGRSKATRYIRLT